MRLANSFTLLSLLGAVSSTEALADELLVPNSPAERLSYLAEADVWRPFNPESIDMWQGPDTKFRMRGDVSCRFHEFYDFWDTNPLGGMTWKFRCLITDENGKVDSVKVKYGTNVRSILGGHVYGEIASSRLLWALGFGADRMYPVRVQCEDCPRDPWAYRKYGDNGRMTPTQIATMNKNAREVYERVSARGNWVFLPAAIEKKFKGAEIGLFEKQGWSWPEFMDYRGVSLERAIHRDALVLLSGGFLHHADSKSENQRLVCLEKGLVKSENGRPVGCTKPFALVHDLGWTFGGGFGLDRGGLEASKMNLQEWLGAPVFKGSSGCVVNSRPMVIAGATLKDVEISEEGRLFLLGLLKNLDRGTSVTLPLSGESFVMTPTMQLFYASYVDLSNIYQHNQLGGSLEENIRLSVIQWNDAFQSKVREIEERRCPKHLR